MARETSREAYHKVMESGLVGRRQKQVYVILYDHGPLPGSQVANRFYDEYGKTARSETVRNRITELRDKGVVREVGYVIDTTTNMRVILWDVTDNGPVRPTKKISRTREIIMLRAALKRYGRHEQGCLFLRSDDLICDCGLSKAIDNQPGAL